MPDFLIPNIDGTCVAFDLHPSCDYVTALSATGSVFIYHVMTATLRGIIPTAAALYNKVTKLFLMII